MTVQHCDHEYKETYYGHDCVKCGVFSPHGGGPWDDADQDYPSDDWPNEDWYDEANEEDYWLSECGWIRGMGCLKAGSEECDWECPHRRDFEKGMALTQARLAKRAAAQQEAKHDPTAEH